MVKYMVIYWQYLYIYIYCIPLYIYISIVGNIDIIYGEWDIWLVLLVNIKWLILMIKVSHWDGDFHSQLNLIRVNNGEILVIRVNNGQYIIPFGGFPHMVVLQNGWCIMEKMKPIA